MKAETRFFDIVRLMASKSSSFPSKTGLRQWYCLSYMLFTAALEMVVTKSDIDANDTFVSKPGHSISSIRR